MSQLCPRCRAVQPQENQHCTECGIALSAPAKSEMPAFRFAQPVLLADETPPPARRSPPEAFLPTVLLTEANMPGMNPPKAETVETEPPKTEAPKAETFESAPVEMAREQGRPVINWKLPVISAVAGLVILGGALAGAARIVSQANRAAGIRAATWAAAVPSTPLAATPKRSVLPLTVLLQSAAAGQHIPVGTPVVITAVAMLPPGQSAALALSCKATQGLKTMFSFAEGRLCSANWTPSAPGRYQFTATALDDQCHSASARPLWISVEGPALTARAMRVPVLPAAIAPLPVLPMPVQPLLLQTLPIVKVSRSLSEWHAPRIVRHHKKPSVLAALPVPPLSFPPVSSLLSKVSAVAPLKPYHVVAASFPFPGNAAILARALRARGLFAVTRRQRVKNGKIAYVVEVGSYPLPDEAQKKTLELQRRGYPAYMQRLNAKPVSLQ